jgi:hypothetical protein
MINVLCVTLIVPALYIVTVVFDITLAFITTVLRMFYHMLVGIYRAFCLFLELSYKRLEALWRKA